jgi:hypothetical protein
MSREGKLQNQSVFQEKAVEKLAISLALAMH